MRIETLRIQNFKKYADLQLSLHPQFTLLVGPNASGKTTILDALAVSLAVWLVKPPDSAIASSRRNILGSEIRLAPARAGDRIQFREERPVRVTATGNIGAEQGVTWTRQIKTGGQRTSNDEADAALRIIQELYRRDSAGEQILCPVLAYYGAGRAWLPSNERSRKTDSKEPARRWDAFYDCFQERIRFEGIHRWFKTETTAAGSRGGRLRPGFEVVRTAVLDCVPGAQSLWFDADRDEIVFSVGGATVPFDDLSAGQRMMLALVADISIKAVTQNAHLLPAEAIDPADARRSAVLRETPGVVLIDELDVHLHPSWQRRVAGDLKRTFPGIQFICTSHSPQVIGELSRAEVRALDATGVTQPGVALGADSNWLLDHEMPGASSIEPIARRLRDAAERALDESDLATARARLDDLRSYVDGETGDLSRLEGSLEALERLARPDAEE